MNRVHLLENATEEEKAIALEAGGARWSAGKARFDLIPPEPLFDLAAVYTFGATKYKDRNWEKGMSWGICFGAAMRHLWKWWRGEENDEESDLPHFAHAAWNVFALMAYSKRGQEQFDDRFKPFKSEEKKAA